jgi:uncharacterized protein with GYD domain
MATFLALINETQEGERKIKDSVARAAAFREQASACGAEIKELYWTMGAYDGFVLFEAPDAQTASALLLKLGSRGAVRTQTLQAFDAHEMDGILRRAEV